MAIILTPTYDTGARAKSTPSVSIPPERFVDDDRLAAELADTGKNMPFIADVLSAAITHERCGRHLYRSVEGRTLNPMLKAKYADFGAETERHVEILTEMLTAMGGDPQYISPLARATEGADTKMLESTFMLAGSVDVMTAEMVMLDSVLLAEAIDHSNWVAIGAVVDDLPDGELKDQLSAMAAEVLEDEKEHLTWAQDTRRRMITLQAQSRTMTSAAATVEEMTAAVRSLFS